MAILLAHLSDLVVHSFIYVLLENQWRSQVYLLSVYVLYFVTYEILLTLLFENNLCFKLKLVDDCYFLPKIVCKYFCRRNKFRLTE